MPQINVAARALIDAPAETVYAVVADYHHGHPRILPPKYFTFLEVEEGGVGEGTVIRFGMRSFGKTRIARARVTEPEPGRRLVETMLDGTGIVTHFVVRPRDDGRRAEVTFVTRWSTPGLRGWVEQMIAPPMLRRIYTEELEILARVAGEQAAVQLPNVAASAVGQRATSSGAERPVKAAAMFQHRSYTEQ
jgi:hypothetical protein